MSEVVDKSTLAKQASTRLGALSTQDKNEALLMMATALISHTDEIITANIEDLEHGRAQGTSESMLDRLRLDSVRIEGIASALRQKYVHVLHLLDQDRLWH